MKITPQSIIIRWRIGKVFYFANQNRGDVYYPSTETESVEFVIFYPPLGSVYITLTRIIHDYIAVDNKTNVTILIIITEKTQLNYVPKFIFFFYLY